MLDMDLDSFMHQNNDNTNVSGFETQPDFNPVFGNDLEIHLPSEDMMVFDNDEALSGANMIGDDSLFGSEHPQDRLFDNSDERGHNISFGLHVEDRDWNLKQAERYEHIEKREQRAADSYLQKGDVKAAHEHTYSAELARKRKEEYIQAAKSCKK